MEFVPYRKFVLVGERLGGPGDLIASAGNETYSHHWLAGDTDDLPWDELVYGWLSSAGLTVRVYTTPAHEKDPALRELLEVALSDWAERADVSLDFDSPPDSDGWFTGR